MDFGGRRKVSKDDYLAEGASSQKQHASLNLLSLTESDNFSKIVNDAMKSIEGENPDIKKGMILLRTYTYISYWVLQELLEQLAPVDLSGHAFGKVYDYAGPRVSKALCKPKLRGRS